MMLGHPERRVFFRAVLLLALWFILNQGCRSGMDPVRWGKEHQYEVDETAPIKMGPNNFPLVRGKINNKDVNIFFDTGNFFGLLIGPGLTRTLKLKPSGNERKNYASDGTYRYSQKGYWVENLTVFRTAFENVEMFEMTDDTFDASVGVRALGGERFTLDYRNHLMGTSSRPFDKEGIEIDEFPLIWNEALRGMIVIEGHVNGIETLVQIDTGKSRTTIDEDLIARAGLKENNSLFQRGYKVDLITLGKKRFSVTCAKVANFKAISEGYPKPILVGIGADILSRVVLTVDYPQKKVFIR
ncbi:MAG TPA: hypothetical protein VMY15_01190 [Candidatus Latescibacteria bacterium]|nr:hypothetical protein [Candidatus Latescibacterota bacterium]